MYLHVTGGVFMIEMSYPKLTVIFKKPGRCQLRLLKTQCEKGRNPLWNFNSVQLATSRQFIREFIQSWSEQAVHRFLKAVLNYDKRSFGGRVREILNKFGRRDNGVCKFRPGAGNPR